MGGVCPGEGKESEEPASVGSGGVFQGEPGGPRGVCCGVGGCAVRQLLESTALGPGRGEGMASPGLPAGVFVPSASAMIDFMLALDETSHQ